MLASLIRAHRQRLGLTQEALAAATGLSARTIRDIETGRIAYPRSGTVGLLADAFGLSWADRVGLYESSARPGNGSAPPDPAGNGPDQPRPTPAQLPADVASFTGRVAEMGRLDALLRAGTAPATVIATISGTAGVGKTALAVHFGHRVRERYPDGALYANLRGFDPSGSCATPGEVLTGFLDALGVPAGRIPPTLAEQANLYRSLLSDRRVLVLLDNARDAEQVRPLLPGAGAGLVVITSRNQLAGLVAVEGAVPLTLDQLTVTEACHLLAGRLGAERVGAEPDAVDEIVAACVRLPLALVIVAARAATHDGFPLAALAAELRDSRRLDVLDGGEPGADVRAAFSWSYRALSPAGASFVRQLGLHPGPELGVGAAASLAGLPVDRVRPLLAELSRANLLTEHSPGRYAYHDLLRDYAEELAQTCDPEPVRRAALARLLDYYLHAAVTADRLVYPLREVIALGAAGDGVVVESFTGEASARHWLAIECLALVAMAGLAARTGFHRQVCPLARALSETLDRTGQWHHRIAMQQAAVAAAVQLGDRGEEAHAHRSLGGALVNVGRLADGRTHLMTALGLYEQLDHQLGQAHTHRNLSALAEAQGRYAVALEHGRQAYAQFEQAGHQLGTARALNIVGWNYALLGRYDDALAHCRRALEYQRAIADRAGQGDTLDSLGYAHHQRGEYGVAIECFRGAIEAYREVGGLLGEAQSLNRLGDCHHSAGEPEPARSAWQESLDIFESLDHTDAAAVRVKLEPDPPPPAR